MLWEVTIIYRKPSLGCDHPGEVIMRQQYIAEGNDEEEAKRNAVAEERGLVGEEMTVTAEKICGRAFYVDTYS
jgi:hypothetical protein